MAIKLKDNDFTCTALDGDTAVITIAKEKYVLDYSTLMDLLMDLASVAARVENGCCSVDEGPALH